jgi:hypothetical protein
MIQQPPKVTSVTIADSAALSGAIYIGDHIGMIVTTDASWTDANMGFQVSTSETGTYTILRDDTGVPVQISGVVTDTATSYKVPDKIFPGLWVKVWSKHKTAGTVTDVNQSGAETLTITLK